MGDIPSGKDSLPVSVVDDPGGNQVTVVSNNNSTYSLKVQANIRQEIPKDKVELREFVSSQLGVPGKTDTDFVIPNGTTWHVDTFWTGSESMGFATLIWDAAGTPEEVARIYVDSSNFDFVVNKDFLGNGTKILRIRRTNGVANRYFSTRIIGYK